MRPREPGIIVRFGRIFWRALALGNVAQIDPDASPGGRAAAHRVDEDIVLVQKHSRLRIPGLPAFEAGERVRLERRFKGSCIAQPVLSKLKAESDTAQSTVLVVD